jgi:phage terminase large subunit-like protein
LWQADSEDKYMSGHMDDFKALSISKQELFDLIRGRECYVGVDLSKTTDLTAAAFVFPLDGGKFAFYTHGFMPKERATQHEHDDRVSYKYWAEQNWITLTDGSVTDYMLVRKWIKDIAVSQQWKIKEFCFDPYNATEYEQSLKNDGYREEQVIEVRQGFTSLSAPTKKFRELVLSELMVHDGNPCFIWCVSNAIELKQEGELIKIQKKHKDDSQRVDLLSASITALFRAMNAPPPKKLPGIILL